MKIALASAPFPQSIDDALLQAGKLINKAAQAGAAIVCFPETYIPGYPAAGYDVEVRTPQKMEAALQTVCEIAKANAIAVIMPMDWYEGGLLLNVAIVVSATGEVLGYQSKNQLDPSEDVIWAAGTVRGIYEVEGLKFGITICHEGFRYPESVRWAARNGAQVVFHPQCTGSDFEGELLTEWGDKNNPYYEKAIMMRAMENTIYFASVNYGFRFPESASSVIAPDGSCLGYQPYGQAGIIVVDIDPEKATGLLAKRFKAGLYRE